MRTDPLVQEEANTLSTRVLTILILLIPGLIGTVVPVNAFTEKRVLIVTTAQPATPAVCPSLSGEFIAADLIGAGYPFDIVTHDRFVNMSLGNHDVIILVGHTSPTPVADVAAKCIAAQSEGRKSFLAARACFSRYDSSGVLVENNFYATALFGVTDAGAKQTPVGTTTAKLPLSLQKDPDVTAVGMKQTWVRSFGFSTQPPVTITMGSANLGFLYSSGGALLAEYDYQHRILDYGKLVAYLRNGEGKNVGFANDRVEGKPIVSFEVHCDDSSSQVEFDNLNALADQFQCNFINLLVNTRLTSNAITMWNGMSSPYMRIGSHTRTHRKNWPTDVSNVYSETRGALDDLRAIIPATRDYISLSGLMNPTQSQLEQIYACSPAMLFPSMGAKPWKMGVRTPSGAFYEIQWLPCATNWYNLFVDSTTVPYLPGMTMMADMDAWSSGRLYQDAVKTDFDQNIRQGMYSFAFIHDFSFDPAQNHNTAGVSMANQIESAVSYLLSQNCMFMFADDLIARLRDSQSGWIDTEAKPDGGLTVAVHRPGALANQVKIAQDGDMEPSASGESVVSQHLVKTPMKTVLYVDLRPEVDSTFDVSFTATLPEPPAINEPTINNQMMAFTWTIPRDADGIAEYWYALGTAPEDSSILGWTSAELNTSAGIDLSSVVLPAGQMIYINMMAMSTHFLWSNVSFRSFQAGPPPAPIVLDDGAVQYSRTQFHARWFVSGNNAGIMGYRYAIGTTPRSDNVVPWTDVGVSTSVTVENLNLSIDLTYYISVQAVGEAGIVSDVASSDGIVVSSAATVPGAKLHFDGIPVALESAVVTGIFPTCVYVEQQDRASGIKVNATTEATEGAVVSVTGVIDTIDGERLIRDASVTVIGNLDQPLGPLAMHNESIGGSALNDMTPGVTGGTGLNNIGLLIRTWGTIVSVGEDYFLIDDGSGVDSDYGMPGLIVERALPSSIQPQSAVSVVGLSTVRKSGGGSILRAIRPRSDEDIQQY